MQVGQYIVDRFLPEFVRSASAKRNIQCTGMSDDWVLRLEGAGKVRWVLGYQFDLNGAATSAVTRDKVATYLALRQAGIAAVPHVLVRSLPHESLEPTQLQAMFPGSFVLKPLDGTGGRGVQKVSSAAEAIAIIQASDEAAWAGSPFCDIATEYRLIILDDKVLLAYEKTQPVQLHGLQLFNLGLGAVACDIADANRLERLTGIAQTVCTQLSLRLAAVDIVQTQSGELLVLEANDGIMMENYARQSAVYKNRAAVVYDTIVAAMFA